MAKELKTKSYTRAAIDKYNASKDRITVMFEAGTTERIRTVTGQSAAGYIRALVLADLEQREAQAGTVPAKQEKPDKPARIPDAATPGSIRELAERVKASAQEAAANRAARKTGEEAAGDILAEYKKNNS